MSTSFKTKTLGEKIHEKYADRVFKIALAGAMEGRKMNYVEIILASIISAVVILIPILIVLLAVYIATWDFPNVPALILAAMMCLSVWAFLPPRSKIYGDAYTREALPLFFDVIDKVAKKTKACPPKYVIFTDELNAAMVQYRRAIFFTHPPVLIIGFPLWASLNGQERIALLAHEMAHQVNHDPLRGQFFGTAIWLLENGYETLVSWRDGDDDGALIAIAQLVINIFIGLPIKLMYFTLLRLILIESQCAEYRADALAAEVAGKEAMRSLLVKTTLSPLAMRAMRDLVPYAQPRNARVFDAMGAAIADADAETVNYHYERAASDRIRVDASHPPSFMRVKCIASLPETRGPTLEHAELNFTAADEEVSEIRDEVGRQLMQYLYDTEINR